MWCNFKKVNIVDIKSFQHNNFRRYARVITGYEVSEFVKHFIKVTEIPQSGFAYTPSVNELESHEIFEELQSRFFGGLPIQLGYCSGFNTFLDSVEYHKCSEICITATDTIFILGSFQDTFDWGYNTKYLEAFLVPANTIIEIYPYSLHYAPCDGKSGQGFQVAVALVKGTCGVVSTTGFESKEDKLLISVNKWIMAHPDASSPEKGALAVLQGDILDLADEINKL